MKLQEIINMAMVSVHSLKELDVFLENNKQAIIEACTPQEIPEGLKLRVSTAVVCSNSDDLYVYFRTPPGSGQDSLRGIAGKMDTPKGVVPFTGPGKWYADENRVTGRVVGVAIATETNPDFGEFVAMPTVVFKVDDAGKAQLDSIADRPHEKLKGVTGYTWFPVGGVSEENAMSKVVEAAKVVEAHLAK